MDPQAIDAPELTQAQYRAMREAGPAAVTETQTSNSSDAAPAGEEPAGAGEHAANAETAGSNEGSENLPPTDDKQGNNDGERKPGQKKGLVDEVLQLRNRNRELEARLAAPPKPETKPAEGEKATPAAAAPEDDPEPDADKYSTYAEFQRDLIKWEIREERRQAIAATAAANARTAAETSARAWRDQVAAARAKYPNFDTVALDTSLPVTDAMGGAIQDSPVGTDILQRLGENRDEAARIAGLSRFGQVREIGKIEDAILRETNAAAVGAAAGAGASSAGGTAEPFTTRQSVSRAPAPIRPPSNGTASKGNPAARVDSMSQAEYRALRESGKL